MQKYNPSKIEKKWQKVWEENAEVWQAQDFSKKPKFYTLFEFPYPSGEGLHMGHLRGQTAVDVYARKKRLEGYNVLNPIGWDAFGLPTENYAIKNKIHPALATKKNIASMKAQEKMLGYFLDWPREINTTDPKYYKWTQWIFLQLFKHGLAYKKDMPINWCLSCKIGLANEEVIDGRCERCGGETTKKNVSQWLLRITKYANKLIEGLKDLDFPDRVKASQLNWIGRSEGANIDFQIKNTQGKIRVFTTRADTLFGATFMVVSPEHGIIKSSKSEIKNYKEVEEYVKAVKSKSDLERTELSKEKTGVILEGVAAINPINNEEIPVFVADYVLSSYGTGAIMAVPAHDQRDWEFAKKYNLKITEVISGGNVEKESYCNIKEGTLVNSGDFNNRSVKEAQKKITEKLKAMNAGDFAVSYKLRDWIFSRQHYWGEPIPIINCEKCGMVAVPESELPVLLPEVENYEPTDTGESPLAKMTDWVNTKCPKCNGRAMRETDTMPNWAGSSWYFLRYIDPHNNNELADMKKLKYWLCPSENKDAGLPSRSSKSVGGVDLYEGGMEHTTLHLLYSRFWNEFLFDIGAVPVSEPYKKRVPHGIILAKDGRKMSKSFGNIVSPDEIVKKYGADCARTYVMFIGPHDQAIAWDENGLQGVWRFLNKVWKNLSKPDGKQNEELSAKLNNLVKSVSDDIESFSMNTAVAKLMEFNNHLTNKIEIPKAVKSAYLTLLYPFAPHIAEELAELTSLPDKIFKSPWPKIDKSRIANEQPLVVVQINGKKRGLVEVPFHSSQSEVIDKISKSDRISEYIKTGYKKVIYVEGKIINLVTK